MNTLNNIAARATRAAGLAGAALALGMLTACAAPGGSAEQGASIKRYPIPGSDFPISSAVEIPAGATTIYLSGQVPPQVDKSKPDTDPAAFGGSTEVQTVNIFKEIEKTLQLRGLSMKDVVKMQAFLVGDPKLGGRMDFAGFMKGYTQFFGTKEQPNLPSRSAYQIAGLGAPGMLIEIEVTAVRPLGR